MKKFILPFLLLITLFISAASQVKSKQPKVDIFGYWVRMEDNLQMEVIPEHEDHNIGKSEIVVIGKDGFPCDIKKELIYKNIIQKKDSVWSCDFLVVSTDDCSLNYRPGGNIVLTERGQLLVVCQGFQPMYYDKKNPRH